ncbi:tyrosine-type recombinase/integrase [Clostridium boliviensis]|uniref:Tyrosine-type recombinase/integrase n=1 Tax=Clostridium boliviensis TaxID=318465 RepID=A0ABU4GLS3_9CLOT|nr:tyrosine-type recombinase/integrase [Clostridium boliviensis]MDW2798544.1 tyrosine-type recombinase/integrase [Clostridium boliviensis]
MTNEKSTNEISKENKSVVDQSLEDFQEYLKVNNMSVNTIHVYLFAVRQFLERYHVISHDNLMLYKCYLMEHYKPQTVNLRIRALNCYMESLKLSTSKMLMIRIQQKTFLENIISQADYEYLKSCLIRDGNMLYYFVVRFIAATGVRVSELVMAKVEHVKCGYMDIYSKDNKIRRVYFPKNLRVEALKWLSQINRVSGYIFLNRYGEPITPAGIRGQLKKFTVLYGLDPKVVYPHSFRHRFAKNFIEKCGDISMLSDILGHESIETTRIYLHRSSTEQKQIVNQIVNW